MHMRHAMISSPRSSLRNRRLALLVVTGLALMGVRLAAHDMWIEPTTFVPQSGQIVSLRLRVGQDLLGDPLLLDPSLVNQFVVSGSDGVRPVVRRDGRDPAGLVRLTAPGVHVIGYRSNPSTIEIPADTFNQYLKEEGLDAVSAQRARRNETRAPAREIFSRCAKSLVLSGATPDAQGDRPLGFPLELVAERNPYAMKADQDLPVRLTYENRPLAGALVVAINRLNPAEKLSARTAADGRVRFKLRCDGMWLIKAVHMVPAPQHAQAEWASFWASLTFEMRNPSAGTNE
jgi:uncharacterized GH25 family protein